MAITTKTTYTLQGVTYGCSDPCSTLFANGDLTASELARFSWCRWEDKYLDCISSTNIDVASAQGSAVMNLLSYMQPTGATLTTHYVKDRIPTKKPYAFNILIYGNGGDSNLTSSNGANYRIVTGCSDFQSLYVKVDKYQDAYSTQSVQFPTARTINVNNLTWSRNAVYNTNTDTYTDYITVWTVYVIDEDKFFITKGAAFTNSSPCCYPFATNSWNIIPHNRLNISTEQWYYYSSDITNYDGTLHMLRWCSNDFDIEASVTWDNDVTKYACWDVTADVSVVMKGYWRNYDFSYYLRTEEAVKNSIAYMGLRWRYANGDTDHIYTPIIDADNYITGWSTDPAAESKLNDIADVTGNNITPLPPAPPGPSGDEIDDMNMSALWAMSSDAGFARYFLLSHDQLASLMTWLSDTTFPDGYDPYAYILSLLQFPLKLTPNWCMPRTPAGHIVIGGEDTNITASLIANEKPWVGAGTYDVPQLNGNFLDYDPYTQYELYIPCAGWVSLPDIVCGRKIAVKINYDLTTAAIIGNVYVTIDGKEMIVASKSGMMGRETIVTGEAQGVRSAQITSALLNAGTGALNVATGAMSGNAVAAVSGGYNIVAGLAQANIAANSAYTRTIGSTGGRAILCQFDQCYLKICTTRADIPDNYGHTCGYVCNLSGKVSAFTGYTVFDNVDVSGIGKATDREKKLIKQILESGVIINPSE